MSIGADVVPAALRWAHKPASAGKTIVMVTHDPHAAERASRVLHLEKGVLAGAAA